MIAFIEPVLFVCPYPPPDSPSSLPQFASCNYYAVVTFLSPVQNCVCLTGEVLWLLSMSQALLLHLRHSASAANEALMATASW